MNGPLIATADWHLSPNEYITFDEMVAAAQVIIDEAAKSSLRTLAIAGDLTDAAMVGGYTLDLLALILDYAREKGVRVLLVEGNHGIDQNNVSIISHLGKTKTSHVSVAAYGPADFGLIGDWRVLGLPFGCEVGRLFALMDGFGRRDRKQAYEGYVLMHEDVISARYNLSEGAISRRGVSMETVNAIRDRGYAVILGHIHLAQDLPAHGPLFARYTGAPVQFNYRAAGQSRGFTRTLAPTVYEHVPLDTPRSIWPVFYSNTFGALLDEEPTFVGRNKVFVRVTVDGEYLRLSDQQISDFVWNMEGGGAVQGVEIHRVHERKRVERKSTIELTDSLEQLQRKYAEEKLPPDQVQYYLDVMEPLNRARRT